MMARRTILIVDDVMLNIDILMAILGDEYEIMCAVSGESAIELMQDRQPDLALLDVSMPGIDGFDVLRFMKSRDDLTKIPVIFVTGEHDENVEEKGLALGAVDYIKKPYNAAVINIKVRNHMELKSYRDGLELLVRERTWQLEERKEQLEAYNTQLEGLTEQLIASRDAVIMGMSLMSESHDKVTGSHIWRIKNFTRLAVDGLQAMYPGLLTPEIGELTVLYSPLHDVGKVGISDAILKKTGKLTSEEFNIMKNHTIEGAKLLQKTKQFLINNKDKENMRVAIDIAWCHHEYYNGGGYPRGLRGDDIPISARIVTLADIYDALRSPRQYKEPFTHAQVIDIILSGDGRTEPGHFDPRVLELFRQIHTEFERVYDSYGNFNDDVVL